MYEPERRRRQTVDSPGWLYAPAGHLRTPWRLIVFAALLFAASQVVPLVVVPTFSVISQIVGEPVPAYSWVMLAAVWVALVLSLRVIDQASWHSIGMGVEHWRGRPLWVGWLLGAVVIATTALLLAVAGYLRFDDVALPIIDGQPLTFFEAWLATAFRLLVLLAPAALWEELVFRGYLWKVADDAGGEMVALWSTSVGFGLIHLFNPNAGIRTTILVVLAGLCLGLVRLRLGLPAAWLAHLAWNWVMAAVLHVPVSGIGFETPGYRADISGPSWLTGGDWGPEGGVIAAVVLTVALMIAERNRADHWRDNWTGVDRRRRADSQSGRG